MARKFKNGSGKQAFAIRSLVPKPFGNVQTTTPEKAEIQTEKAYRWGRYDR